MDGATRVVRGNGIAVSTVGIPVRARCECASRPNVVKILAARRRDKIWCWTQVAVASRGGARLLDFPSGGAVRDDPEVPVWRRVGWPAGGESGPMGPVTAVARTPGTTGVEICSSIRAPRVQPGWAAARDGEPL